MKEVILAFFNLFCSIYVLIYVLSKLWCLRYPKATGE